jgi:hypothetical protein
MRHGLFVALGLAVGSAVAQSNEDYLKSLEGEAESVILDKQTKAASTNTVSKTDASKLDSGALPGKLISGLTIGQFEKVLQQGYLGSYLFYKHLNKSQKDMVYASYQENPDPDSVRDIIQKVSKK